MYVHFRRQLITNWRGSPWNETNRPPPGWMRMRSLESFSVFPTTTLILCTTGSGGCAAAASVGEGSGFVNESVIVVQSVWLSLMLLREKRSFEALD